DPVIAPDLLEGVGVGPEAFKVAVKEADVLPQPLLGIPLGIDRHKDKLNPICRVFELFLEEAFDVAVLREGAGTDVRAGSVSKKHHDDVASLLMQPVLVAVLVVEDEIGSLSRGIKSRPIVGAGAIDKIIGVR